MYFLKSRYILVAVLISLLTLSYLEAAVSQSATIGESSRKTTYVVLLSSVAAVGFAYWRSKTPAWMRKAWIAVYILVFVVLFLVGFLQTGITVFDSDFLDQVRYFRVFFTSPLPFLLSVLISRIDFSPREQKDN